MKRVALAAVAALLLVACGPPDIEIGYVVEKGYRPSWTQMVPITTCRTIGKVTSCSVSSYVPVVHPECWSVTIEDGDRRAAWCVTEETYESVGVGGLLDLTGER